MTYYMARDGAMIKTGVTESDHPCVTQSGHGPLTLDEVANVLLISRSREYAAGAKTGSLVC